MLIENIIELCAKHGLGIVLAVGILLLCVWLVKFIVIQLSKAIDSLIRNVDKLSDKIEDHDKSSSDRSRFQREEHRQMIEVLTRINGYKK